MTADSNSGSFLLSFSSQAKNLYCKSSFTNGYIQMPTPILKYRIFLKKNNKICDSDSDTWSNTYAAQLKYSTSTIDETMVLACFFI